MGGGSWSDAVYCSIKSDYSTKSTDEVFTSKGMDAELSPLGLKVRESRDSEEHPESLAIVVGLDVTGSMGHIADSIAREKLGTLMETVLKHDVKHPQILFMGIGDQYDIGKDPIQVSQFESETTLLDKWLTKIWLHHGGGGQHMESYALAWLIAGRHTSIDCFEKRNIKGLLFTIGDEWVHPELESDILAKVFGYTQTETITSEQALKEAQQMYHVFHLHVNEASYKDDPIVIEPWKNLLGERLIIVEDYSIIAETIATIVAYMNGADIKRVTAGMSKTVGDKVSKALAPFASAAIAIPNSNKDSIVTL
jgi:hypothetical protein